MDVIGIEISDAGILAAGGAPPRLLELEAGDVESPGYALAVKKQTLYGRAALEQARLSPRQVNDRFWSQLSTYAVPGQPIDASNYAEVAFEHLRCIRDRLGSPQASWSIAAPGFLDTNKLGILLGIARELNVRVVRLASLPVAASQMTQGHRFLIHVDMHLHNIELCRLAQADVVRLDKTRVIPEDGLDPLLEGLCRHVANEFVRSTRFDPLHHAATEQQLFLHLLRWLREGRQDTGGNLEISTGRTAYSLVVLPQMLLEAAAPVRRNLMEALRSMIAETGHGQEEVSVQVSHRAAAVPGLVAEIRAMPGVALISLPVGAGAFGALAMAGEGDAASGSASVTFSISRRNAAAPSPPPLPVGPEAADPAAFAEETRAEMEPPSEVPTHVLLGHRAYVISEEPLRLGNGPSSGLPCRIRLQGGRCFVESEEGRAVLLDNVRVTVPTETRAGQTLVCNDPPLRLVFIAVGSRNAT